MKIVDLTHTFTADMSVYPGDPKSSLKQVAHIEKDTFNDYKIETVMHVGTHMDAPFHMIENGKTMDEILPEKFFGPGVLVDVRNMKKIGAELLENTQIEEGSIVLLYTGFANKYKTNDYFKDYPDLAEDFAKQMIKLKVTMVGMDMLSPDFDAPWKTHKTLLGNDILLLENLTNLDKLLNVRKFQVVALPAKFKADAAPVRVVAIIEK